MDKILCPQAGSLEIIGQNRIQEIPFALPVHFDDRHALVYHAADERGTLPVWGRHADDAINFKFPEVIQIIGVQIGIVFADTQEMILPCCLNLFSMTWDKAV
jgi:hypothetical protein